MYRIYAQIDDFRGYHTAVFYDREMASKYFKNIRAKYPDGYIVTEVLDNKTGDLLLRKEFGKKLGATLTDVKLTRGELISLVRYDIRWKDRDVVAENITPDEADELIVSSIGEDGYGTEWIYTVQHGCFVSNLEKFEIPERMKMKVY